MLIDCEKTRFSFIKKLQKLVIWSLSAITLPGRRSDDVQFTARPSNMNECSNNNHGNSNQNNPSRQNNQTGQSQASNTNGSTPTNQNSRANPSAFGGGGSHLFYCSFSKNNYKIFRY